MRTWVLRGIRGDQPPPPPARLSGPRNGTSACRALSLSVALCGGLRPRPRVPRPRPAPLPRPAPPRLPRSTRLRCSPKRPRTPPIAPRTPPIAPLPRPAPPRLPRPTRLRCSPKRPRATPSHAQRRRAYPARQGFAALPKWPSAAAPTPLDEASLLSQNGPKSAQLAPSANSCVSQFQSRSRENRPLPSRPVARPQQPVPAHADGPAHTRRAKRTTTNPRTPDQPSLKPYPCGWGSGFAAVAVSRWRGRGCACLA